MNQPGGLRLIADYKLLKGIVQLVAGVGLAGLLLARADETVGWLHDVATLLREHAAPHWSVQLADSVLGPLTRRTAWIAVVALAADGALTSLEGWSLRRGKAWGEWLVVVASGLPVPIELYELGRHPHAGRAVVLLLNALVVAFLVRRRLRARRITA